MHDGRSVNGSTLISGGHVIAFHNNEKLDAYRGLSCRDAARYNMRSEYLMGNEYQNLIAEKGSLEEGILRGDKEVLEFISRTVKDGHHVFLDFRLRDAQVHNSGPNRAYFKIASLGVVPGVYNHLNFELFTEKEQEEIDLLVFRSQGGRLKSRLGFSPLVEMPPDVRKEEEVA